MTFNLHIFAFSMGLAGLFLAVILNFIYRGNEPIKAQVWWAVGIALIGSRFILLSLEILIRPSILFSAIQNLCLVSGLLCIYLGSLLYLDQIKQTRQLSIFSSAYLLALFVLSLIGMTWAIKFVSVISAGVLSILNARLTFLQRKSQEGKTFKVLSITMLLNGLVFIFYGIFLLINLIVPSRSNPAMIEQIANGLIFINTLIWSFGFFQLINQRVIQDTKQTKEIYGLMMDTIPDAILITRLKDGKIIKVNEGFTKISGYKPDEIKGKTTLDIDIWYDPTQRQKFSVILSETGSVERMEFQFRRKNGKPLMGLMSSRTIEIEGVTHILSVVRDVTKRKKMEDKLRENEEKYRFLSENSGDVIWHINKSLRVDYISTADELIRGFKREEVVGQPVWNLFKPEGIQLVREKIDHHQQVEQVGNNMNVTRFEIEQRCKDGSWIWTEITAAPHYDQYGELIGYHGISRDISEKKRLLEKLHLQATIDELCQIPNRRHFMKLADAELTRAKRYHHPLSMIIIDFDNLKYINDTHGHLAGDRALTVFSKIVKTLIRDVDIIGRFGGDEFLILLPETDQPHAYHVLERIDHVLETSPVFFQGENFKIFVSAGIAGIENWTDTLEDLINRADSALYEAKSLKNKNGDSILN